MKKDPVYGDSIIEQTVGAELARIFTSSDDDIETRLANFPRYARRMHMARLLSLYEIFKLCLPNEGSIAECGVFRGFFLMTWAHLSAILEANNINRRIYGFDSFTGFPSVSEADSPASTGVSPGQLASNSAEELTALIELYDRDRFLGHIDKVSLISGDVTETIPAFLADNQHLVVSLLFLDLDLYEPTRIALKHFLPRMHRGSVIAFDELDRKGWPGETLAAMAEMDFGRRKFQRNVWDMHISFAVLD